jgi:hypothetical protein
MSDGKIEKLAVLIDADNAQPSIVDGLLSEIAKYGTANVKRIYGDWTLSGLKGWKEVLLQYSIQPIQQFGYTSGKNATAPWICFTRANLTVFVLYPAIVISLS